MEAEDTYEQENQPASANVARPSKRGQTPGTGHETTKKPKKSCQSLMSSYPSAAASQPVPGPTPRQPAEMETGDGRGRNRKTPATAPASQAFESQLPAALPFEEVFDPNLWTAVSLLAIQSACAAGCHYKLGQ